MLQQEQLALTQSPKILQNILAQEQLVVSSAKHQQEDNRHLLAIQEAMISLRNRIAQNAQKQELAFHELLPTPSFQLPVQTRHKHFSF